MRANSTGADMIGCTAETSPNQTLHLTGARMTGFARHPALAAASAGELHRSAAMRVIRLLGTIMLWWATTACATWAQPSRDEVTVVSEHVTLAVPAGGQLSEKLVKLLESCSVNSTASSEPRALWKRVIAGPSFLHVRFASPRTLRVMSAGHQGYESLSVREILLPLPSETWPDHVLIKGDTDTLAFTKYAPEFLKSLVGEPALQLSTSSPYDSLLKRE